MNMKVTVKKWSILTLCFTMAFTCIPLFESAVFAADDEIGEKVVELSEDEVKANREKAVAELDAKFGVDNGIITENDDESAPSEPVMETDINKKSAVCSGSLSDIKLNDAYDDTGQFIYVSDPDENGSVIVQSADLSETSYRYTDIYIADDYNDVSDLDDLIHITSLTGSDQLQFSKILDMKYFTVGYHTLYVALTDGVETRYAIVKKVPTYIYQKVSNSLSNYYTYITKFTYQYTDSTYYSNSDEYLTMFMDYRKKGGNWSEYVYRMDDSYTTYEKKGLKANTTYQVRLMLGKTFTYGGETFTFTGRQTGNASSAKTIKTAYKKPKVKKIDISKVKQYCHKYRVQYAWRIWYNKRTGVIVRRKALYHTYRYWYTRFKVTTKFSKKQGVAGIRIDTIHGLGVWKGGNKKSYSQTFTCRGKKKGKKITIRIKSCRSKKYGGWSKTYKKKVRCR
ncbi:MAG: hypothetical protein IKF07_08210 [Eubacterium sp.]|nr:hypothetical protein [Eubacterium sp.]